MNKSEYLMLRYVINIREPVAGLAAEENDFHAWFNAPYHGLASLTLIDVLHHLFQQGDIIATWRYKDAPDFAPTKSQLERAMDAENIFDPELFDYGLTSQGGQRWEDTAHPDWRRYFSNTSRVNKSGEVIASNRLRAQQFIRWRGLNILSSRWDILRPWKATYWKKLPVGHRIRYTFNYNLNKRAGNHEQLEVDADWWDWFTDPS